MCLKSCLIRLSIRVAAGVAAVADGVAERSRSRYRNRQLRPTGLRSTGICWTRVAGQSLTGAREPSEDTVKRATFARR